MQVTVQILKTSDFALAYHVGFQGIGDATKLLLMSFRRELALMVAIDPTRIEDKEYAEELNKRYIDASELLIDKYVPGTRPVVKKLLVAYILNIMLGLGELEAPLADENLEEIAVNGSKSDIWVFHKVRGWCKTNIKPASEEMIYDQAEQIGRRIGKQISNLEPLMDAELSDGSRVNATLYPDIAIRQHDHYKKVFEEPVDHDDAHKERHGEPRDCGTYMAVHTERDEHAVLGRHS